MAGSDSTTFFAFEIQTSSFIPHRWLFEDFIEECLERSFFNGSNIYYLTVVKKERIKIGSPAISKDGTLSFVVEVGTDHEVPIEMNIRSISPFAEFPELDLEYWNLAAEVSDTKTHMVFRFNNGGDSHELPIDLVNILNRTEVDLKNPPRIVYVGQSFDMLNRWQNHKQVNRALSLLADNEELRLSYFHFRFCADFQDFGDTNYNTLIDVEDRDAMPFRDRISLVEQALIKFYRPELNTQHLDDTLSSKNYQRLEELTGIFRIGLGLGVHGYAHQYWSRNQVMNEELITLEVVDGKITFHKGLLLDHLGIEPEG